MLRRNANSRIDDLKEVVGDLSKRLAEIEQKFELLEIVVRRGLNESSGRLDYLEYSYRFVKTHLSEYQMLFVNMRKDVYKNINKISKQLRKK